MFVAVMCFALGFAFMPKNGAVAAVDTTSGFYVEDHADVRIVEGESGIKWTGHINKSYYDALKAKGTVEFGLSIIPEYNGVIADEMYREDHAYANSNPKFDEETGDLTFNIAIYYDDLADQLATAGKDVNQGVYNAYTLSLAAQPYYVVKDGAGEIVERGYGASFDSTRSIQGVAVEILSNPAKYTISQETADFLKDYVNYGKASAGIVTVSDVEIANAGFYSFEDAKAAEQAPLMQIEGVEINATDKLYAGAKDITYALSLDGTLDMSNVLIDGVPGEVSYLTLFTVDGDAYKIPYTYASLVLNAQEDFARYNLLDGTGYYVMVDDIDLTGYVAPFEADIENDTFLSYPMLENGLTGTFDGNGYTLSNYTMQSIKYGVNNNNGNDMLCGFQLFPYINNGVVKNLRVTNLKHATSTGGGGYKSYNSLFAGRMLNGATVVDCEVEINQKQFNSAWDGKWMVHTISNDSSFENLVVYWDVYYDNTGSQITYGSGAGVGVFPSAATLNNVVVVSPFELNFGGYQGATIRFTETSSEKKVKPVTYDAAYVDGVVPSTTTSVYYDGWNMQSGYKYDLTTKPDMQRKSGDAWVSPEYTINLIQGVKRYTKADKMLADVANNAEFFANYNKDVWEIVNGVPTFLSTLDTTSYELTVDGAVCADSTDIPSGSTVTIGVAINGLAVATAPVVTATSGNEFVEIDGNKVTLNGVGSTATLAIAYRNKTFTLNVIGTRSVYEYEKELQLSAHDGVLFDGENVVALEDVFSSFSLDLADVTDVSDELGNTIAITDGKITGIKLGIQTDWVNDVITLSNDQYIVKINVRAAELIMDEFDDFAYFKASGNSASYGKQCFGVGGSADNDLCDCTYAGSSCPECGHSGAANVAWTYYWAAWFDSEDDMKWQGYYVLAKDIDAQNQTHDLRNGFSVATEAFVPSRYDYLSNTGWYKNGYVHGFGGVFDGQGHTISNLQTIASYGLLGIINGGTVQNVGFINCNTTGSSKGFLAQAAIMYSVFRDVYVSTPAITPQAQYTPLVTGIGHFGWNWERVVIIDNTTLEVANGRYYGSITADAERHVNNKPATFGYSLENVQPFKGTYVVSNKPMSAQGNGTSLVASLDARYVDGKEITLTASSTTGTAIVKTNISKGYVAEGADLTVGGIYRYTTYENFVNDAANRDFSGFSSDYWTMAGVPVWNGAVNTSNTQAFVNGINVVEGGEVTVLTESSNAVTAKVNGVLATNNCGLELVEGNAVTIEGGNIVAGKELGTATVKATCAGASITFNVIVEYPFAEHPETVTFSALDGDIDIDAIFGEDAGVRFILDAEGNELTYSDGKVLGLKTSGKEMTATHIDVYGANKNVRINLNAYTMIIDEASDLELFTLKGSAEDYSSWNNDVEGDFEWDGYYILGQDIDCTNYTHDFNGETNWNASSYGVQSMVWLPAGKGLTGTFDGNGYSITNFKFGSTSLFGIVNGGVVKNARMTITTNGQDGHGSFGSFFINEGKMQDCIIEQKGGSVNSRWATKLVFYEADATARFERIVVHYAGSNTAPTAGMFGSPTNDAFSHFTDSIFISSHGTQHYHPVHVEASANASLLSWADCADCAGTGLVEEAECATCAGNGKVSTATSIAGCKVAYDAKYVDGVERSNQESSYYRNGSKVFTLEEGVLTLADGSTSYEISLVEGIRRYTSFNALKNDTSASLQAVLANYTSSIWTITDNRPVFAKTTLA